ncbi:hypothetical protein QN239_33385 [Mycolicibacterium sp. Y3]
MAPTLQLDLTATRQIAERVTGAASVISGLGFRLRLRTGAPATDSATLLFCHRLNSRALQLSYVCEDAGEELMRTVEALLGYADNAATLARRTELAIMGLDVDEFVPTFQVTARHPDRHVPGMPAQVGAATDTDHRVLSEALLLSAGGLAVSFDLDVAHVRAAADALRASARDLRSAMASGQRPAAMLDQYGSWFDSNLIPAIEGLLADRQIWNSAYTTAQSRVLEPSRVYHQWLGSRGAAQSDLTEVAARARAELRAYRSTTLREFICSPPPHLADAEPSPESQRGAR